MRTPEQRFWKKVNREGNCWVWTGAVTADGYGNFRVSGHNLRAHRFSYALLHGPIPDGLNILHACDNRLCVRPNHLCAGTQKENIADAIARDRMFKLPGWYSEDPSRRKSGEKSPNSKLTDRAVEELRREYATEFVSQRTLAKKYGVSQSNVSLIVRRVTRDLVTDGRICR